MLLKFNQKNKNVVSILSFFWFIQCRNDDGTRNLCEEFHYIHSVHLHYEVCLLSWEHNDGVSFLTSYIQKKNVGRWLLVWSFVYVLFTTFFRIGHVFIFRKKKTSNSLFFILKIDSLRWEKILIYFYWTLSMICDFRNTEYCKQLLHLVYKNFILLSIYSRILYDIYNRKRSKQLLLKTIT